MIEKSNKDVFYYIHLKKLGEFSFDKFDFMERYYSEWEKNLVGQGSLNNLLADFVNGLQIEYHSTT